MNMLFKEKSQSKILCEPGGDTIWYLLDCCGQEEEKIMTLCRERLSDAAVKDAFILTYDRMLRYAGAWHMERRLLFPSYVFLESSHEETLFRKIQECNCIAGQKNQLDKVGYEEERFLKRLCGEGRHLKMSRGIIRKGTTKITEGPLKGMENRIRRIDRHKRLARVETALRPDGHFILAGLEITEKIV